MKSKIHEKKLIQIVFRGCWAVHLNYKEDWYNLKKMYLKNHNSKERKKNKLYKNNSTLFK